MARLLTPGLERQLRAEVAGDVLFDSFSRGRYATDASHYQIVPLGIVVPRTVADVERAIAVAGAEGISVTPRGGGTSQAGQAINDGLVIDCSKHLTRILELDLPGRRCVVEPGIVLDEINRHPRRSSSRRLSGSVRGRFRRSDAKRFAENSSARRGAAAGFHVNSKYPL